MTRTSRAAMLGMGAVLWLAGCGGRIDDAPTQAVAGSSASTVGPQSGLATAPPSAVADAASVPGDSVEQLRQEVAQLHREMIAIRQQLARSPNMASAVDVGPDPRVDSGARIEAERVERARVASSEAAFQNEQRDARWSQGATANVRTALSEIDDSVRNQVRSVDCRAHSCRVEIAADPNGAMARDLPMLIARMASTMPNVTAGQIDQGDGRTATVLYLSR